MVDHFTEDEVWVFTSLLLDIVEELSQRRNTLLDMLWSLKVCIAKLDLLEHGEANGVNEHHTAVYAGSIDHQNLLIGLLEGQKLGLGAVEGRSVIEADKVFATLIGTYGDALLGKACILLNVPDL